MKKVLLSGILATALAIPSLANHPDSIYIRPDVKNGTRDFQIAYSQDKIHWTHVHCNLFESDYGPWGSEKKLYYPVLTFDGKAFHATFIPNPNIAQIATTTTSDLSLWKPQDYPFIEKEKFNKLLKEQKKASANNIIKVPYSALQSLLTKEQLTKIKQKQEAENYVVTANKIGRKAKNIKATLNINPNDKKAISDQLMGVFFEDISYAADGGLYAELIQNRDFEYNKNDRGEWNATTAWNLEGDGIEWSVATDSPIHANNQHYVKLTTKTVGGKISNIGWDGIALSANEKYDLSIFVRGKSPLRISLVEDGNTLASCTVKGSADTWKQRKAVLRPKKAATKATLVIEPLQTGTTDIDFVSLFPQNTFKGRKNGLRKDLAQTIADLKPRFVRFPGGCASHGQGIDNIYHWQQSVGDLWERQYDMNIWHYHQTRGLGFYEYFTFCEDIGAEPLPVLAAGVPCQNSWKGGNGQQGGIPFEKELNGKPSPYIYNGKPLTMESYLQELLDLIEWANGDAKTSKLAAMRAKAGHPKPFGMKYLGIGNEDLISDVFMERYLFLLEGIKKVHPEITLIGTVGPFWEGSDYEYGWKAAKKHNIAIVDEHYYNTPGWYFNHRDYYDNYDRNGTKVYLGEWASKGNRVSNALVEAAYLTNVERNADVVTMTSYAPLLAKEGHTNWNPDLIYFNNTEVKPTANYYVQKAFGQNAGDTYVSSNLTLDYESEDGRKTLLADITNRIDRSVVIDSKTGDVIIKIVSMLPLETDATLNIGKELLNIQSEANATITTLAATEKIDQERSWHVNETKAITVTDGMTIKLPAWSFTILRISNGETMADKKKSKK